MADLLLTRISRFPYIHRSFGNNNKGFSKIFESNGGGYKNGSVFSIFILEAARLKMTLEIVTKFTKPDMRVEIVFEWVTPTLSVKGVCAQKFARMYQYNAKKKKTMKEKYYNELFETKELYLG